MDIIIVVISSSIRIHRSSCGSIGIITAMCDFFNMTPTQPGFIATCTHTCCPLNNFEH